MPRKITVRNPEHPVNIMNAVGQHAKEEVRKLSNNELDQFIIEHLQDSEVIKEVLKRPRNKKIKLIQQCAMRSFAEDWQKKHNKVQVTEKEHEENDVITSNTGRPQ